MCMLICLGNGSSISKPAKRTALRGFVIVVFPTVWVSSLLRSKSISWVLSVRRLNVLGECERGREGQAPAKTIVQGQTSAAAVR